MYALAYYYSLIKICSTVASPMENITNIPVRYTNAYNIYADVIKSGSQAGTLCNGF